MRCDRQIKVKDFIMARAAVMFVSKRLQRVAFAFLCLITAQMVTVLSSCEPEPSAMAARVAIFQP
ncbi:hypothetical protein BH11PSE2_BH11PSE2_16640 [soil metagenome]